MGRIWPAQISFANSPRLKQGTHGAQGAGAATATGSGSPVMRGGGGWALEEAGSAGSLFCPSERGQAHRRRLPIAARVGRVGVPVKSRWSSGG
jgi:hypothetical protein